MSIQIYKVVNDEQLQRVAAIAEEIWHECFVGIISIEQISYMVKKFQSYDAMKDQIKNQNYNYFAVECNNKIGGYFAVKPEDDERFFLSKLYLHKSQRGQGTASIMMKKVFKEALNAGKSKVYLTVNKHNDHAIAVYKKTGFSVIDDVKTDIGSGFIMDDYVMEYNIKNYF